MFIDGANPRSAYGLAYNVVNCADNQRTFNDGYHIQHHLNSRLHWSELPGRFRETLDAHAAEDGASSPPHTRHPLVPPSRPGNGACPVTEQHRDRAQNSCGFSRLCSAGV